MTHQVLEERVGRLEETTQNFRADLRVMGNEIASLKADMGKIVDGVGKLVDRERTRPDALTWKTVIATLISVGAAYAVIDVWSTRIVTQVPMVTDIERRLMRLDDAEIGRVGRIERHLDSATPNWAAKVTRYDR